MRRSLLALGLTFAAAAGPAPTDAQTLADYDYENLSFRGVGVDFGYVWPSNVESTVQYGLRLDLGYLGPGVRIIPSIAYWRSEFKQAELDDLAIQINRQSDGAVSGEDLGPIEWSDLSLSVDGHFVWNTPVRILTFAGGGLSLHALNGQGDAIDDTLVEDLLDVITLGFSALGGFEFSPVDRFRVYGEGRYTILNSIQYLSARAGVQFMLGGPDRIELGTIVPATPPTETGRARE